MMRLVSMPMSWAVSGSCAVATHGASGAGGADEEGEGGHADGGGDEDEQFTGLDLGLSVMSEGAAGQGGKTRGFSASRGTS